MIPTTIDGTDITGATIDGTDVTEITVDGDTVFTAGPAIPQPPSGVAYWTFDNADTSGSTATDVWGGNDGTINGATTGVSGANDQYTTNEAYRFDGTDDDVNVGDTLPHGAPGQEVTAAAWINLDSVTDEAVIGSPGNWVMRIENGQVFWRTSGGNNGGDGSNLSTGTWFHVVVTWDAGSNSVAYVDGSQTDNTSFGDTSDENEDFFIGDNGQGVYFDGEIDDVRVYDKVLSSSEVSDLYSTGSIL